LLGCSRLEEKSMKKRTSDVLEKYMDLFAEPLSAILNYFELLEKDEKPSVNLEIYNKSLDRIRSLKKALEKTWFLCVRK